MSEEPYLPPREPGNGPESARTSCLWVAWIWFGPSVVVPLICLVTLGFIPVGLVLSFVFLMLMGSASVQERNRAGAWRVFLYVVLQMVWIPLFSFAVLWGICAMNGGMRF